MSVEQNPAIAASDAPDTVQPPAATEHEENVGPSSLLDALRGALDTEGEPEATHDATPEPDAAADGEQPANTAGDDRPRGPDGRFLPKDAAQAKDGEPPATPDPNAPAPKPDAAADDPYREPEGLKPEAQERFRALVTRAKESQAAAEAATAQSEELRGTVESFQRMIIDSGATDQEFMALLDFARAVKSGDWRAAEPMLGALAQQFRVATGRDPAGADPFAQHADLAQAVQEGKITPEAARQVLQARQVLARDQAMQQQQNAQQQTQQQQVAAVQQASTQVRGLVQQWARTDLDWPKKQAIMAEHAKRIGETMPPEHWQAALQMAYDAIGQTMTSMAPARTPVGPGTPQPLRPASPPAGRKEPASLQEAIAGAIGGAA